MLDKFSTFKEPIPEYGSDERRVIDNHREHLISHSGTVLHTIRPELSYPEEHNWYRYLLLNSIPANLFYPIMVVNDITDMLSFNTSIQTILIPDNGEVQSILSRLA